jgi:hypothetical protein
MVNKSLNIYMRKSTDIGLYDGFVTPALAAGVCFNARPKLLPVPTLNEVRKYGFDITLEIHPREFESGKILRIIYPRGGPDKISPAEHPHSYEFIETNPTRLLHRPIQKPTRRFAK